MSVQSPKDLTTLQAVPHCQYNSITLPLHMASGESLSKSLLDLMMTTNRGISLENYRQYHYKAGRTLMD